MCGICGVYNFNNEFVDRSKIKTMCSKIVHRGPDDEGIYLKNNIGMGMRRLSIIDLDSGKQPISNEDESIWTVFNGEIYNYLELKDDLLKKGHKFTTKSDTEVLVHLYEEHGMEFVKMLRGMFAFTIFDEKNKKFFIVRDQLGIKPLFYLRAENSIIFASEIKSILSVLPEKPAVDNEALYYYFNYFYFPGEFTAFKGIKKLLPGHFIEISDQVFSISKFWDLNNTKPIKISFEAAKARFNELLQESIKLHLRSDVPVGVFLSGGIDSSAITALANKVSNEKINTFTVGYGDAGSPFDERKNAQLIADQFKTNHKECMVSGELADVLPKLILAFDQPFANSSAIPNYLLSKEISKHVKVALSGLGGDELAGGYERYLGLSYANKLSLVPKGIRNLLAKFLEVIPHSKNGGLFLNRLKRLLKASDYNDEMAYYKMVTAGKGVENKENISKLMSEGISDSSGIRLFKEIIKNSKGSSTFDKIFYYDITNYMVNDLLDLTDITSMASSLEVRVPFLDVKLVEFMYSLPLKYKIRKSIKKFIIKKVFDKVLPRQILYGKKKGFSTPFGVWFRDSYENVFSKLFTSERVNATEFLDPSFVEKTIRDHLEYKSDNHMLIFSMVTFILWHESYIQDKGLKI